MILFFGLLQVMGWIIAGYNIHANNWWAVAASLFFALLAGLANATYTIGERLENGNSSQLKRP